MTPFDELRWLGGEERSIVVQTRAGTALANVIEVDPAPMHRRKYGRWFELHGRNWQPRKPVTGGYNCAGHVWASRRASLVDPRQWRTILEEDGFVKTNAPVPDDVVLYVDEENDEIIHVARVVELREGIAPQSAKIPWIVSKWGPISGEAMHYVHDVPYGRQGYRFRIEYFTDRPMG
jgi:hypothetical protein